MNNFSYTSIRNYKYEHRTIYIGLTDEDCFIAFTTSSPHFFVVDNTEQSVLERSEQIINHWLSVRENKMFVDETAI